MAQTIYKLFFGKPSPAGYQVPQEEQQKLFAKVDEALTKVGGKRVLLCNSGWASEQWTFWGVEQFPDVEALQKYTALVLFIKRAQHCFHPTGATRRQLRPVLLV